MSGIGSFNDAVDYIEAHLAEEISIESMARMAKLSVYEFRRVFSFVAGISVSEYIRRRRLSVAAEELLCASSSVTDLAMKYGYDTPSSFSRAFKEFHGCSPRSMMREGGAVHVFTRISFDLRVMGGKDIQYSLRWEGAFALRGLSARSDLRDTECCETAWTQFYASNVSREESPDGKIYAAYTNGEDWVDCTIGFLDRPENGDLLLPPCRWACFTLNRTDDAFVNGFYKNILFDWLSSSGYRRASGLPNLEVYPVNMEEDGFLWEIRIPIEG